MCVHGLKRARLFDNFTLCPLPPVHLLCRNLTGRYLWTAEPVWSNDGAPTPKPTLDKLTFGSWVSITDGGACDEEQCIVASNQNGSAERLDAGETPADDLSGPPVWSPKLGDRDMIQELLK